MPDVLNDLDIDFSANPLAAASFLNDQRNIRKIKEAVSQLNVSPVGFIYHGMNLISENHR